MLTYSSIGSFLLKFGPRDKSRGRAEGCLWICLGVLRPNPRATGQIEIPSPQPTKRLAFNQNCKVRPAGGPLFAGNRHRAAIRKIPTFVLSMHVGSSEKAPKRKFEHWWFAEQPSQQERRRADHSNLVPVSCPKGQYQSDVCRCSVFVVSR